MRIEERRMFTSQELSRYDGRNGAPAYVACGGLVYDVSDSFLWREGRHQVTHQAGCDCTSGLLAAPHGDDLLKRFPVVGISVADSSTDPS